MAAPTVVADIMTHAPEVLREEDNLEQVARLMARLHVRHLPVVDGKRLVGLLSHHDVLRLTLSELMTHSAAGASTERRLEQNTFVVKVMTRDPLRVTPQTSLAEAARLLYESKVSCLPVVKDGDELVGIVTESDFLGLLVSMLQRSPGP
jgi:CBS domain-containing membrane protein